MFHKAEIDALESRCVSLEVESKGLRKLLDRQGAIIQEMLLRDGLAAEDVPPVPAKTIPAVPGFVRLKRIVKKASASS